VTKEFLMKKLTNTDPETKSPDLAAENLARLRTLFPELITEGLDGVAVNLDVLKQLVNAQIVTDAEEKYGLNWHGKRRARQLALTPSTGTLRPCPADSVDWDTTHNLMIEGDNLEVLKLLQKSFAGKVKLIYIDPPYNTGRDFVYPDDFQDNIKNYIELTGQTGEDGRRLSSNTEASGRFHTDWLNMMYPRLKLARNLLQEDGVIFVSIDDGEMSNLKTVLDEIFGSDNFVAQVVWEKMYTTKNDASLISTCHDYILCYARQLSGSVVGLLPRTEEMNARYTNPDNDPRGPWKAIPLYADGERKNGRFKICSPTGRVHEPLPNSHWRYIESDVLSLVSDNRVYFGKTGDSLPNQKLFLSEVRAGVKSKTLWTHKEVGSNDTASREVKELLGQQDSPFSFPKPTTLIRRMIHLATDDKESVVLDFFGGSGTTAHGVFLQNAEDGLNRRFILVQLPEPLDAKNKEQKAASDYCDQLGKPRTIAELTKERLRRAGKKVREDNPLFAGDLGFRVFKLDSSNIRAWEPDREKLPETLEASIEHLKTDRTEQDILFELLLKLGLDLCVPIETQRVEGGMKQVHEIHSIGGGSLLVCLSPAIPQSDVEPLALGLVAWHKALNPAGESTVVFRDSAFVDDVAKTNLTAILNQHGLETVRSL
jgi:adenine-specific DNA-methyltransferase